MATSHGAGTDGVSLCRLDELRQSRAVGAVYKLGRDGSDSETTATIGEATWVCVDVLQTGQTFLFSARSVMAYRM